MPEPHSNTDATAAASSIQPVTNTGSDTLGSGGASASHATPNRVGPYQLLGELGRGGMGVVYRAEDPKLKRDVAIKLMLPQFAANPLAKARFVREARSQAKVEHEHVAAIYQVDEHEGLPYLVMPLLKGMTLQTALKANSRPPLTEVIRLGREMAEGLAAAHEKGLVHRDIKPANIWLEGKKLRVKVLDFGLARAADTSTETEHSTAGPVTQEGGIVGTPAYMSPEQARGDDLDGRTDLWSLGVVLYQMTTGELPFIGKNAMAVLARVGMHNPPPPSSVNSAVPPVLSDVIMRLLAKNPDQRQPTAEAVVEELRAVEGGLVNAVRVIPLGAPPPIILTDANAGPDPFADLDATEANSAELAAGLPAVSEPAVSRPVGKPTAKSGGFPVWAMVAGVLLAVGGVVGFVVSQMGKKPPEVAKEEPQPTPPKKETPKKDTVPSSNDSERDIAQWLAPHAYLIVRLKNELRDVAVDPGQALPLEAFHVQEILFRADRPLPPPEFIAKLIPALTRLNFLFAFRDQRLLFRWSADQLAQLAASPLRDLQCFDADFDPSPKVWEALNQFRFRELALNGERITDEMTVGLPPLNEIGYLRIAGLGKSERLTAKGWASVLNISKLDNLTLVASRGFNSEACKVVAGIPGLRSLLIQANTPDLDEASYAELAKAPTLQSFATGATTFPDAVVKHIAGMKTLRSLILNGKLSQAGLDVLSQAKPLRSLELWGSGATDEEIKKLNAALPRCAITWDKGTLEPSEPHFRESKRWIAEGGSVTVKLASGKTVEAPPTELPEEPFTITGVSRPGQTTDEHLKRLAAIPTLTSAYLPWATFSTEGLRALLNSRETLTYLHLRNRALTEELTEVMRGFPNLRTLELPETGMTDPMLKTLSGLSNLVTLSIHDNPISDASVDTLSEMKKLTDLYLERTRITKAGFEKLKVALPNCNIRWEDPTRAIVTRFLGQGAIIHLRGPDGKAFEVRKPELLPPGPLVVSWIQFSNTRQWTDADMLWLEPLANPHLEQVGFYVENNVTAVGLQSLLPHKDTLKTLALYGKMSAEDAKIVGQLSRLEHINIDRAKLTESETKPLAELPQLRTLELPRCDITERGLEQLAQSKSITNLTLAATLASDAGIEPLAAMKQLTSVNLLQTRVTEKGFKKLKAALPDCAIAWEEPNRSFAKWALTHGGFSIMLELPDGKEIRPTKLEELPEGPFTVTWFSGSVDDAEFRYLQMLTNLKNLKLAPNHKVTIDGFRSLLGHKNTLVGLDISDSQTLFTDEGVKILGQMPNLVEIAVGHCRTTDEGLEPLARLTKLNVLRFFVDSPIGDAGLKHIASIKNLHQLYLPGSRVTDVGLKHISEAQLLRDLHLPDSGVSDAGLVHLTKMKSLLTVGLANTAVTDAGVEHLAAIKALRLLNLSRTRVTELGLKKLKAAIPTCAIDWSPRPQLQFDGKELTGATLHGHKFDLSGPLTYEAYLTTSTKSSSEQSSAVFLWHFLHLGCAEGKWHMRIWKKGEVTHPVTVGQRTHVAGVLDGNVIRLYIDGKLIGSKEVTLTEVDRKTPRILHLGFGYTGVMEEVRLSSVVRYDKDFTPSQRFTTDKDTIALYHLDEGTPGEVRDSSGNNRNCKIENAKWVTSPEPGEPKKP